MLSVAWLALVVGLLVGNRFKILVLLPTISIACALTGFGSALLTRSIWAIVADLLVVSVTIQVGYFFGLAAQYVELATQRRQL